jgi:hypothetical protein
VKFFAAGLTPAIRFSCSSKPHTSEEAGMNVRYRVELSQTERAELTALLSGGKHAARKLKRAQICWPPTRGQRRRYRHQRGCWWLDVSSTLPRTIRSRWFLIR